MEVFQLKCMINELMAAGPQRRSLGSGLQAHAVAATYPLHLTHRVLQSWSLAHSACVSPSPSARPEQTHHVKNTTVSLLGKAR